jgi:hypothetical protein
MISENLRRITSSFIILLMIVLLIPGLVQAQGFDISYSDPANDVEDYDGHVYDSDHENIDIIEITSSENILGTQLVLTMTVSGVITDSSDIIYYFYLLDGEEPFYIIIYINGDCQGISYNSDSESTNLPASGAGTDTLEVRIQTDLYVDIGKYDFYGQTDENYNDGEQYLMDVAPDDALDWMDDFDDYHEMPMMITEPRPGATVSQDVTIEGICDPFYDMESVEIQFDSQSAAGWLMTSTSDNWETWSHNWDSTVLSDGEHTLNARAYDGSEYHFDSITVYVDQNNAISPRTMEVPELKIGSELHYTVDMSIFDEMYQGMEYEQTYEMVLKVEGKESITVNGNKYEAYIINMLMTVNLTITFEGESMTTSATASTTQWVRISDLADIKSVTETSTSSLDFNSTSETTLTYDPPLDSFNFPINIAEKWTSSSTAFSEETYFYDGEPDTWEESYETKMDFEALHVKEVTVPAGTYETFVIWSRESSDDYTSGGPGFFGSGPGYSLNYFSEEVGFPVKSELYYPDRELYMTMELESYYVPGEDKDTSSSSFGGDLPLIYLIIPLVIAVIIGSIFAVRRKRKKASSAESWDVYSEGSSPPAQIPSPVVSQIQTYSPQTTYQPPPPPPPQWTPPPPTRSQSTQPPPPLQPKTQPRAPHQPIPTSWPLLTCPKCQKQFYIHKYSEIIKCPHCGVAGKLGG